MTSSAATHNPTLLHGCCFISHRLILGPHKGHAYLRLKGKERFPPLAVLLFTVSVNSEQLPQSETRTPHSFFKVNDDMQTVSAGSLLCSFVCFDLKKNPGKRFPAFSVTNSEPMTDLFPMLPLVFRPLTNTHSTTNTYSSRNSHSRAAVRAALGSIPSN